MGINPFVLYDKLTSDLDASGYGESLDRKVDAQPSSEQIAVEALKRTIFSKFRDNPAPDANKRALREFLYANLACSRWRPERLDHRDELSTVLGYLRAIFNKSFEVPGGIIDMLGACESNMRPGPGSAVGASGTDFYTKLAAGPLGFESQSLADLYIDTVGRDALSCDAEVARMEVFGASRVEGSKLGFSPKKTEVSRITVSQPSGNMLYQLGTGTVIEEILLERFGLNIRTQPALNAELARRGSITGEYATLDMKMSSDLQSRQMFSWLFLHKDLFQWLCLIRSKSVKLPSGNYHPLHMMGQNGTGFTFPLQTLLFSCVVHAVYRTLGIPIYRNSSKTVEFIGHAVNVVDKPGNWGVFGDDIIVKAEAVPLTIRCLEWLGQVVNMEKSYWTGHFRESCGSDYFNGVNVRGVYCKSLLTNARRLALYNRLQAWSANHGIILHDTMEYLGRYIHGNPVPLWESAVAGVIMPLQFAKPATFVSRSSVIASVPRTKRGFLHPGKRQISLARLNDREANYEGSYVYTRYESSPKRWDPVRSPVVMHAKPFVNWAGILLTAVRGYSTGGYLTPRSTGEPRYLKRGACVAPGWGFAASSQVGFTPEGARRYESYVASCYFPLVSG